MKFIMDLTEVVIDTSAIYPLIKGDDIKQVTDMSASGVVHVETFLNNSYLLTFSYSDLPTGDYTKLVEFFRDIAVGAANLFDIEDDIGVLHTDCRFTESTLSFSLTSHNLYNGSFTVRAAR